MQACTLDPLRPHCRTPNRQESGVMLRIFTRREDVMRKLSILAPLFLVMALNAWAEDSKTIVGSWKLVSTRATTADGKSVGSPMGEHPTGFLTYTADGRMSLLITHDGRPRLGWPTASNGCGRRWLTACRYLC